MINVFLHNPVISNCNQILLRRVSFDNVVSQDINVQIRQRVSHGQLPVMVMNSVLLTSSLATFHVQTSIVQDVITVYHQANKPVSRFN